MTLIKSISGIRGTIGGGVGDNLTPIDTVKFTTAFAKLLAEYNPGKRLRVVVGRDARLSGEMVENLVVGYFDRHRLPPWRTDGTSVALRRFG